MSLVNLFSIASSRSTDSWIPTYPSFHQRDGQVSDLTNSGGSSSLSELKSFWAKTAESHDERVFRGNSPLKLLKPSGTRGDLANTTVAVISDLLAIESNADIDGEPLSVPQPQPALTASPLKGLPQKLPIGPSPNKWRDNLKTPPNPPTMNTPSRPPLHPSPPDAGATIPILPSNANACWPPKSPPDYQTPKPIEISAPPSGFAPRYTPAPGPLEIITESLAPLPFPPSEEDQYEMTEWEDSDTEMQEDDKERKRSNKKIPAWCIGWIETAKTQTSIDPDTVFGLRLPRCDLSVLFGHTNNAYMRARNGKRGSSGEWGMDDMTRKELAEYRQVMGHTQQLEQVVILRTVEHLG